MNDERLQHIVTVSADYQQACDMARWNMRGNVWYPSRPENKEDHARYWAMRAKRLYDDLRAIAASSPEV